MRIRKLNGILVLAVLICSAVSQQNPAAPATSAESGTETSKRSADSLTLSAYSSPTPVVLVAADLKAMSRITVTFHNTHTNADETYTGVRVADILAKLKAPLGSDLRGKALTNYVVATGSDGYSVILSLAEVDPTFHPGEVIVADTMNGKPLDAHNGPLKLVVTEDKRPARCVRNLVGIELKTLN
jgi:hypothetical protein